VHSDCHREPRKARMKSQAGLAILARQDHLSPARSKNRYAMFWRPAYLQMSDYIVKH
jgi:hypothetical protein